MYPKKTVIKSLYLAPIKLIFSAFLLISSYSLLVTESLAASLNSPAAVTDSNSAMYSTDDIYNRLKVSDQSAFRFPQPSQI